jgi:hypothetical protein
MSTATLHLPYNDRRRSDRAMVLVDADAWVHLSKFHWVVTEARDGEPSYVVCDIHSRFPRSLHREAFILKHGEDSATNKLVDHINRRRTDCRSANLRAADHSQSACNRGKALKRKNGPPTSQYKGVWRKKPRLLKSGKVKVHSKPWVCEVSVRDQGKKHTSCHTTEHEAALKYNQVAQEWMGKFVVLNDLERAGGSSSDAPAPTPTPTPAPTPAPTQQEQQQ